MADIIQHGQRRFPVCPRCGDVYLLECPRDVLAGTDVETLEGKLICYRASCAAEEWFGKNVRRNPFEEERIGEDGG